MAGAASGTYWGGSAICFLPRWRRRHASPAPPLERDGRGKACRRRPHWDPGPPSSDAAGRTQRHCCCCPPPWMEPSLPPSSQGSLPPMFATPAWLTREKHTRTKKSNLRATPPALGGLFPPVQSIGRWLSSFLTSSSSVCWAEPGQALGASAAAPRGD